MTKKTPPRKDYEGIVKILKNKGIPYKVLQEPAPSDNHIRDSGLELSLRDFRALRKQIGKPDMDTFRGRNYSRAYVAFYRSGDNGNAERVAIRCPVAPGFNL